MRDRKPQGRGEMLFALLLRRLGWTHVSRAEIALALAPAFAITTNAEDAEKKDFVLKPESGLMYFLQLDNGAALSLSFRRSSRYWGWKSNAKMVRAKREGIVPLHIRMETLERADDGEKKELKQLRDLLLGSAEIAKRMRQEGTLCIPE